MLALGVCWLLSGCEWSYLLRQGTEQANLLVHRAPVREVLHDPGLSPYRRLQLERVGLAKRFARERLGLNDPGSYDHLCLTERKALSWVVSACPADSLRPHTWWFPLVGEVPYKGFFDPREADEEARNLASRGLVTHVRPVEAYSLLGWLPDPLYTPMLDQSPERLVEVVLHELTHATVYVPGRADFNEAIATFVGRQGARQFWATGEASGSCPFAELERQEQLRDRRTVLMRTLVRELEDLFTEPWSRATRLGRAEALLRRAATDLGRPAGASPSLTLAEVSLFRTYDTGTWAFERLLDASDGDLRSFIRRIGRILATERPTSRVLASWQTPPP